MKIVRWFGAAKFRLNAIVGFFLSVAVMLSTTILGMPQTAQGIHCPTAPVQSVVKVSTDKKCCVVTRKPREGEPEFKQCRCAEKGAGEVQKQAKISSSSRQIQLAILSPGIAGSSFVKIGLSQVPIFRQPDRSSPPFDPATPPPQLI